MHKDIEFIKYCVSKVDGFKMSFAGSDVEINDIWYSIKSKVFKNYFYPLIISQTCDKLGVSISKIKNAPGWFINKQKPGASTVRVFDTADEARIAAIKRYMEVEG